MTEVVELVPAAGLGRDRSAVEHAPDGADQFVEPVESLAEPRPEFDAVGLVLQLVPRTTDPEDRSPVAGVIERCHGLRNEAGIPERVRADEEPEPDLLGLAGPSVEQRPALEDGLVRITEDRVQVVPGPQVGVAETIDSLRRIEHLGVGRGLAPEQDA